MLLNRPSVSGWLSHAALLVLSSGLAGSGTSCLGQSVGATSDGAARVIELTGQVSLIRDSGPWALNVGSQVAVKQVIVTGPDGFAVFQVSDGSTFEVYPNSRVTFRANPSNWRDLLDVWLGRVKVQIEKLSGQPNPNRIRTPTAVISVRGTKFDVAVEDQDSTLVSVDEGQVAVQHAVLPSGVEKVLNQGEYLRIYRDQPLAKSSPSRGVIYQQVGRAVAEALYRVIYRNPAPAAGPRPVPPAGGGGGAPLPGDTENNPPPPPPPAAQ